MCHKHFFKEILHLESVNSTNTYLKINDLPDKSIVYSFNQTEGRGRNDKKWTEIKNKNIAISAIFFPQKEISSIWYIAAFSLAAINTFKKLGIKKSWIKWPNDLYINDEKIGGILTESIFKGSKQAKLIVGIGINVNCSEKELNLLDNKATSVFIQTGKTYDIQKFFNLYIEYLNPLLETLVIKNKIETIRKKWLKKCKIKNKNIEWINGEKSIHGKVVKIENDGTLKVKSDKQKINISSGEVKIH